MWFLSTLRKSKWGGRVVLLMTNAGRLTRR